MILEEAIADDLKPRRKGGITFYPAAAIERIFDWAESRDRRIEWVEGVFYRPETDEGQLSLSYMHELREQSYRDFRATCVRLAAEMEAEAMTRDMGAYFELGISDTHNATLQIGESRPIEVTDELQLRALLKGMGSLEDGCVAALQRGSSDFIKATRHGEFWAVVVRREGMWGAQSFTAEMTSEYSERRVRESRQQKSLRSRVMWWLRSPPPERALSINQVVTLFTEYLAGKKFTLPMSGASA